MNGIITLMKYHGKSLFRERSLILIITIFPILLIIAASASAPTTSLPLKLDGKLITPLPDADEVIVALYSVTAVALVTAIVSFFATYELKQLIPRLKISGYSIVTVFASLIGLLAFINVIVTILVAALSTYWITPKDYLGYLISLFLSSLIFSTLGIIVAYLSDSKHLGLNVILTVAVIDAGFLENPVYSRRYDEQWMKGMPAFGPIRMLLRSAFDTGKPWTSELLLVIAYELALILLLIIILRLIRKY